MNIVNEKGIEDTLAQLLKIVGETNALVVGQGERLSRVEERLDAMDKRFDAIDQHFDAIDQRFAAIDRRFVSLEQRLDHFESGVNRRFDKLTLGMRVLGRRQDKMAGRIDAVEALVEESQATRS